MSSQDVVPFSTFNFIVVENNNKDLLEYTLRIADNTLILGHRISEWCGHGPSLETDIGLTNIALDLLGHARAFLQYAAKVEGKGRTEDDLASLRDARNFKNLLLVELPNGNFADTIARQFFFDTYNYHFMNALQHSKDADLAAAAEKALKEIAYHYRYSAEWVIRLGDGTDISHQKMQTAITEIWDYVDEIFESDDLDDRMVAAGIGVDLKAVKTLWDERINTVLAEAKLSKPQKTYPKKGGKKGLHTEQLGFILAQMQWMQRAYPGLEW